MTGKWHELEADEVLKALGSGPAGLTRDEAARRLKEHGPNRLLEKARKTTAAMFLNQFRDFMILILAAAAVTAGVIGELADTLVILTIVIANAVIGFIQEYRAEKAMEALKAMAEPHALVVREGSVHKVDSALIVPGDVVLLEAGSFVPADMRLIETAGLQADEAALTGESAPVDKQVRAVADPEAALGDRLNMAYKGTVVTYGRGSGVVTETAMKTELGRIASMLQEEKEMKTPLQRRLVIFGKRLAIIVLSICALVFAIGILRGEKPLLMLLTAISLAVAAIPEALPAVITISLALGARKMVRKNALLRKLAAVETLGSVTYICSDKTGTLTQNRMAVEEIYTNGKVMSAQDPEASQTRYLLEALALSNDAEKDAEGNMVGDPTETALYAYAGNHGCRKEALQTELARVGEIPFDSERKSMTTIHRLPSGGFISFTKGAADALIAVASGLMGSKGVEPVEAAELLRTAEDMAGRGLRVLCIAAKEWATLPETVSPDPVEKDLIILGLVGILDPPREEAMEAVSLCKTAGIRPVMITGDHPLTARVIAERVGILEQHAQQGVITGRDLQKLSDEELEERVEDLRVYARVAPEQKLRIVKALQTRGQFVAMTGDGVNDAPALKRADIGIAMGITGTDVSKGAADMILLDDNFATIVNAVREGRKIYDNIRKFIRYLLTTNSGEIWTLFLAQILGLPVPLLPVHILCVNLVTDSLPALALSVEPGEEDIMERPPRHPQESIFAHGLGIQAIWVGLFMAALVLGVQASALYYDVKHWQTMVFTVLCFTQFGSALAVRSEKKSLFSLGIFSNPSLFGAIVISFALQAAVIYIPPLQAIFHTMPLSAGELVGCLAVSSLVFFAMELEKVLRRKA